MLHFFRIANDGRRDSERRSRAEGKTSGVGNVGGGETRQSQVWVLFWILSASTSTATAATAATATVAAVVTAATVVSAAAAATNLVRCCHARLRSRRRELVRVREPSGIVLTRNGKLEFIHELAGVAIAKQGHAVQPRQAELRSAHQVRHDAGRRLWQTRGEALANVQVLASDRCVLLVCLPSEMANS